MSRALSREPQTKIDTPWGYRAAWPRRGRQGDGAVMSADIAVAHGPDTVTVQIGEALAGRRQLLVVRLRTVQAREIARVILGDGRDA